jgi:hypothetical protein
MSTGLKDGRFEKWDVEKKARQVLFAMWGEQKKIQGVRKKYERLSCIIC